MISGHEHPIGTGLVTERRDDLSRITAADHEVSIECSGEFDEAVVERGEAWRTRHRPQRRIIDEDTDHR